MLNENVTNLITAIVENPELQAQLEEAVNTPPKRGAEPDKGLGSALLSSMAQSQGMSFGSSDMSQLLSLLGAVNQAQQSAPVQQAPVQQNAGGGLLNLFGGGQQAQPVQQPVQQSAQPQIDDATMQSFLSLFGNQQAQPVQQPVQQSSGGGLLNLFGGGQQAQPVQQQSAGSGLLNLLGGGQQAQPVQQQSSGMSPVLQLLLQLLLK